jgi:hypothetical protein
VFDFVCSLILKKKNLERKISGDLLSSGCSFYQEGFIASFSGQKDGENGENTNLRGKGLPLFFSPLTLVHFAVREA